MELVAIDFDHDLLVRPEEVDLEAGDSRVHERYGEAGSADQPAHPPLGLRARQRRPTLGLQKASEVAHAGTVRAALDRRLEITVTQQPLGIRLGDRPLE